MANRQPENDTKHNNISFQEKEGFRPPIGYAAFIVKATSRAICMDLLRSEFMYFNWS